jgi:hypothetical protein
MAVIMDDNSILFLFGIQYAAMAANYIVIGKIWNEISRVKERLIRIESKCNISGDIPR